MTRVRFYSALLWMRVRTSLTTGMQYRWDFLIDVLMSVFWAGVSLLPLWVVSGLRNSVEGWTYPQMIVVAGWFILLKGLIDGAINPSLIAVVEHIRQGTLDFVLIKPADAQFLISTEKFDVLKMIDVGAGLLLLTHAFHLLGRRPDFIHLGAALLLLIAAVAVLYSLWLLVVCVAFWVVRLDNLAYLFMSVFDFARWPISVFKGALRLLFTFIIPLAIMTTYPAEALLGRLSASVGVEAFAGAVVFSVIARLVWLRAISRYTSASS
jgi:ABC-2 type transport system permease protein